MFKQSKVPVIIVAAMNRKRVLGKNNNLLWHIPADLKRFKRLTLGHPIIMGRKTFESILEILKKPLPERTNIIVTRDKNYSYPNTKTATSLEEAFSIALSENPKEIHLGGGAQIYELALPFVDKLFLTLIDDDKEGDVFFPDFEADFKIIEKLPPEEFKGIKFKWVNLERKNK